MKYLIAIFLFLFTINVNAQILYDTLHSVKLTATMEQETGAIKLVWINDPGADTYDIYRKEPSDSNWGELRQVNNYSDTTYTDENVEKGEIYEYQVIKHTGASIGYGYIISGIEYVIPNKEKTILLLVEEKSLETLASKIDTFARILTSEGWITHIRSVNKDLSVQEVKQVIIAQEASSLNLTTVLLLGNVPLPHSGNINPDGHTDHKGGWSADIYYGEINGTWTDSEVNNTTSENPKNHNIPGDGNLDQSFIPDSVDLVIGRVDCSELPIFENMDEYQLLDRYLDKNIAFRTGEYKPRRRAVFKNRNAWQEGLGQNALRNFSPIVSPDSITYYDFFDAFYASFLWSYGGSSGSQISSLALGNIETYSNNNFQATFTAYFGSYYGDYDFENNYLRTVLASGTVLTTAWVGAPHWFFHPMAMGFDMGYCTLLSQNNIDTYNGGYFPGSIHINLLGDPTLRSFNVRPPSGLALVQKENELILSWEASPDDVVGYHVYRREEGSEFFQRISEDLVMAQEFTDSCVPQAKYYDFLVRAVKLELTPSGSYFNESSGPILRSEEFTETLPIANFDWMINGDTLSTTNLSQGATQFKWIFNDGSSLTDQDIQFKINTEDNFNLTLIASNECYADTIIHNILYSSTEKELPGYFKVYPNPAQDYLIFELEKPIKLLKIVNMSGVEMYSKSNISEGSYRISTSSWPRGVYIVQVGFYNYKMKIKIVLE